MSQDKSTIKLISLNTWGGNIESELHEFILKHSADTDIFCFQEIFDNAIHPRIKELGSIDANLYTTITDLLPRFKGYYAPHQDDDEGLAIFVKPHIKIDKYDDIFVHRSFNSLENEDGRTVGRNIQYIEFTFNSETYTVINFHGLWNGNGKSDSTDRIKQSHKIKKFIDESARGKVILVGDFNLDPETESLSIIVNGMRNLIIENGITSTRSKYFKWPNKYADYAIVTNELNVVNFEVLQDQVSDHLPLLIEFKS